MYSFEIVGDFLVVKKNGIPCICVLKGSINNFYICRYYDKGNLLKLRITIEYCENKSHTLSFGSPEETDVAFQQLFYLMTDKPKKADSFPEGFWSL
jgi:hypothetical protein